jgi:hypothetical protein
VLIRKDVHVQALDYRGEAFYQDQLVVTDGDLITANFTEAAQSVPPMPRFLLLTRFGSSQKMKRQLLANSKWTGLR